MSKTWQNPFQTEKERAELVKRLLAGTSDVHEREVLETVLFDVFGVFHVHEDGRIQHVAWLIEERARERVERGTT